MLKRSRFIWPDSSTVQSTLYAIPKGIINHSKFACFQRLLERIGKFMDMNIDYQWSNTKRHACLNCNRVLHLICPAVFGWGDKQDWLTWMGIKKIVERHPRTCTVIQLCATISITYWCLAPLYCGTKQLNFLPWVTGYLSVIPWYLVWPNYINTCNFIFTLPRTAKSVGMDGSPSQIYLRP